MSLFNMPNWVNHIEFGIVFLFFPILDGITTNIALTKYGGREANPIMAWVVKKISNMVAMFIPCIAFWFSFYFIGDPLKAAFYMGFTSCTLL